MIPLRVCVSDAPSPRLKTPDHHKDHTSFLGRFPTNFYKGFHKRNLQNDDGSLVANGTGQYQILSGLRGFEPQVRESGGLQGPMIVV